MQHLGPIAGVAAHDTLVATAGYDNRLILWDRERKIALARATHDHLINACDFSHDGAWLVSASSDYTARVWSVPELRLVAVLAGHGDDVDMARFSPDDSLIATCALDRIVRVFSRDGLLLQAMTGHTGNVLALAWIDQRRFITTSVDGNLREWDAKLGICVRVTDLGMRSDCVEIAADGTIIAGDDAGRIVMLRGNEAPGFVAAHSAGIKKLVLARDGTRLVTLGYDRTVVVWDMRAGDPPREIARGELPSTIWARAAAVCPDGRIAVGTFGGSYAVFDPTNGSWDCAGAIPGTAVNAICEADRHIHTIGDAGQLCVDGIASGGPGSLCNFLIEADGKLYTGGHLGELCEGRSGQRLYRHHSPLNCAAVFKRRSVTHLAVGTYTGEILIFALVSGMVSLVRTVHAHTNAIKGLAAAHGLLFSVSANTDIAWHQVSDWNEQRRIAKAHDRIANACCSLGAAGFASVGRDRMLRLWLPEGAVAIATPHPNSVKCIAASPCGRWIASGSYGGTVAVFDRAGMSFAPMRRISKAGISALCWSVLQGDFMAADYAGNVHRIAASIEPIMREAA